MLATAALVLVLAAHAQVVDRLVAVVGGSTVVTASDVELEGSIAALDKQEVPFWRHGTAEERLLDAALVRLAAADVALYQPTPEAIRGRVSSFRGAFANETAWQAWCRRWGLDDTTLTVLFRRRLIVERYLQRNIATRADDEEAWLAEVHRIVTGLASRIQVRRILTEPL